MALSGCEALLPLETRNAPETAATQGPPLLYRHKRLGIFQEKRNTVILLKLGDKPRSQMPLSFTRGESNKIFNVSQRTKRIRKH